MINNLNCNQSLSASAESLLSFWFLRGLGSTTLGMKYSFLAIALLTLGNCFGFIMISLRFTMSLGATCCINFFSLGDCYS